MKTISRFSFPTNVLPFTHTKRHTHTRTNTKHTYVDMFGHINNNLDRILNSFFDYYLALPFEKNDKKKLEFKQKRVSFQLLFTQNMSLLTEKKTLPRNIPAWIGEEKSWTNFELKKSHIIQSINSLNLIFLLSLLFMDRFNFSIVCFVFCSVLHFKMRIT